MAGRSEDTPIALHGVSYDPIDSLTAGDKWTDGRNVYFYAGESRRVPGERKFADVGRVCDADVIEYVDNGVREFWIYACARPNGRRGIGATDGTNHYDLTPAGWPPIATAGLQLTVGNINNIPFINHPEFGPFYWSLQTTDKAKPLLGWPVNWTCRVMRTHKEFLMAIAVQSDGGFQEGEVKWSNSAEAFSIPTEWVPTPANDAGDALFSTPGGPLVDGISVRDQFYVAKADYTGALQYIGGSFVFQKRDVFPSMGVISPGAWVESRNMVYQVTGELEIVRHDGNSVQNLVYGVAQRTFKENLNAAHTSNVFMVSDATRGQIIICYPAGTSERCNEGLTIEAETGDLCFRDLPGVTDWGFGLAAIEATDWDSDTDTWNSDNTTWNQAASGYRAAQVVFAGGPYGMFEVGGNGNTFVAGMPVNVDARLERSAISFDTRRRKTLLGIEPIIGGNDGDVFTFRISAHDRVGGPAIASVVKQYELGVHDRIDCQIDAKLITIGIETARGGEWGMGAMFPTVRGSGRW